jgi:hypothetical protein
LKRDEWLDAVQEVYNSFAIKKSQVKRKPTQIDDAWLAELEADPTFAGEGASLGLRPQCRRQPDAVRQLAQQGRQRPAHRL